MWTQKYDDEGKHVPMCIFCGEEDAYNLTRLKGLGGGPNASQACGLCYQRGAQERYHLGCIKGELDTVLETLKRFDFLESLLTRPRDLPEVEGVQAAMSRVMQAVISWRVRLGDPLVMKVVRDLEGMKYMEVVRKRTSRQIMTRSLIG